MRHLSGNELEILVNGRPVTEYFHENCYYIEGRKNSEYIIRFKNNNSIRKKIVVSVDGLNVISGNTDWTHGYVINPWATIDIPGWRKNENNVAKFKFSSIGKSYNQHNEEGETANIGVIGVKVFQEKPVIHYNTIYGHNWNWGDVKIGSSWSSPRELTGETINVYTANMNVTCDSMPVASSESEPVAQSLGTQWGKNQEFKTTNVYYEFYDDAHDTLLIYYDSREGLTKRGIQVQYIKKTPVRPNAFPTKVACPPPR